MERSSSEWDSSQWPPKEWQCIGITEARDPDFDSAAVPGAWAQALVAAFEGDDWGLSGGGLTALSRPGRIPVTPPDNSALQGQPASSNTNTRGMLLMGVAHMHCHHFQTSWAA